MKYLFSICINSIIFKAYFCKFISYKLAILLIYVCSQKWLNKFQNFKNNLLVLQQDSL